LVQRKWRARMRANKLRHYYSWRLSRHVTVPYEALLADKYQLMTQIAAMKVRGGWWPALLLWPLLGLTSTACLATSCCMNDTREALLC
jgi:hypothetical protein